MTTLKEVARLAGVAPITVSRVMNNAEYVSVETRQRVMAAVDQLGYVPNTVARSLRSRHSGMLALVLSDVTNPFFTTVARGVEDAANAAGFHLILCNTDESEAKQEHYLKALLERRVDGILLVPAGGSQEPVRLIQKMNIPVVVLDRRLPGGLVDIVRCGSAAGAYQLCELLLKYGHRRIAVLSGPQTVSTALDRVDGYLQALKAFGLKPDDSLIYHGEFTIESGYQMTLAALVSGSPTAIFAINNFIAIGCLKALKDLHVGVPDKLAVVCFDDLPAAMIVDPFLTVAAQPAYEMGRKGAELLLERLMHGLPQDFDEIVLPTELIVRESSGMALVNPPAN